MADIVVSRDKIGFIIMDMDEIHFGTLSGNTRKILHIMSVYLPDPKNFGRRRQASVARDRMEKLCRYVKKTAQIATHFFIDRENRESNVSGLILAGADGFKTELSQSDEFDPLLKEKILNVSDESHLWKLARGADEEETP